MVKDQSKKKGSPIQQGRKAQLSISEILGQLIERQRISESEIARQTGLPQTTISRILLGGTEDPRVSTLTALANFFQISLGQLTGHEPLNLVKLENSTHQPIPTSSLQPIPVIEWSSVPSWHFARATSPRLFDQWVVTEQKVSNQAYALKSQPAMSPTFKRGSVLIVDPETAYSDGHYVIIALDGINPTVRQIMKDGGTTYLKPIQISLPTITLEPTHRIFGTIIEVKLAYFSSET